jgi:hypothetical protein
VDEFRPVRAKDGADDMTRHTPISLAFPPRLLAAPEAAQYIGVSVTTLRGLGLPRRILGGKRLYDRIELDAFASSLPIEGEDQESGGVNSCDAAFGITP